MSKIFIYLKNLLESILFEIFSKFLNRNIYFIKYLHLQHYLTL